MIKPCTKGSETIVLANAANRCRREGSSNEDIRVMVIDISRAYFYAPSQRNIYVRLPPEDPRSGDPNICGKLKKSLYGTRDAGANWYQAYTNFLLSIDLLQGSTNPCHFFSGDHTLKGIVHGDDFLSIGEHADQEYLWNCSNLNLRPKTFTFCA